MATTFRAFISYCHAPADRAWASWLHRSLEAYRLPRRLVARGLPTRLGRVFRDEDELAASPELSERISAALEGAEHLIVVCSSRTPESVWVGREVARFEDLGRRDQILLLLTEGEPATAFPAALRAQEPLAADVRPLAGASARSRCRLALLRLVAGMLRIEFDELRQRDEERARRRLLWTGASGFALAAVFFGVATVAVLQWQRAEHELRISTAQRLAIAARNALLETTYGSTIGTVDPERGVLLALESLATEPTIEGDAALREGLWRISDPPLLITAADGAVLLGVGEDGSWLLLQVISEDGTGARSRAYAVATEEWSDVVPTATPSLTADPPPPYVAGAGETVADGSTGALMLSPDRKLRLAEDELPVETNQWTFASYRIVGESDGSTVWRFPHDWQLQFAAFSLDARYLVTVTGRVSMDASEPGATALPGSTVRVFDLAGGRTVAALSLATEGGITHVALSPERDWLATQDAGDTIRLWPLWPETLRAEACRQLTRNLSRSEWVTFIGTAEPRETCPGLPVLSE
jgi:hypothetical protein